MHMDSSDLVLDEEGALETKVSVGRERTPFSVSPTLSLLLSLSLLFCCPQRKDLAPCPFFHAS